MMQLMLILMGTDETLAVDPVVATARIGGFAVSFVEPNVSATWSIVGDNLTDYSYELLDDSDAVIASGAADISGSAQIEQSPLTRVVLQRLTLNLLNPSGDLVESRSETAAGIYDVT